MEAANLPLIETVFGISFPMLKEFRSPHFGLFWELIRESYPICQEVHPLAPPISSAQTITLSAIPPLSRLWFLNSDNDRLIQVQSDRFISNWKRKNAAEKYVGYETCKARFLENFKIFQTFLDKESLGSVDTGRLEISYVNHIPQHLIYPSQVQMRDVVSLLDFSSWSNDDKLPVPKNFTCQFHVEMPHNLGELVINVSTIRRIDNPEPLLDVSLTFSRQYANLTTEELGGQFDEAHEWIVNGFKKLTSDKVREAVWTKTS